MLISTIKSSWPYKKTTLKYQVAEYVGVRLSVAIQSGRTKEVPQLTPPWSGITSSRTALASKLLHVYAIIFFVYRFTGRVCFRWNHMTKELRATGRGGQSS